MGEAKRRAKSGPVGTAAQVFTKLGIKTTQPGFYDDPLFQAQEARDPAFLENYARFVRDRDYSPAYLDRARVLIPAIAQLLHNIYAAGDRRRSCMDAGLALSKMLEAAGIWNFVVRGAFSAEIDGSPETIQILHAFGQMDPGSTVMGHVWLLAPPYTVVDVTAKLQGYPKASPLVGRVADVVLATESLGAAATVRLLVDSETRMMAMRRGLADRVGTFTNPAAERFLKQFPGTELSVAGVKMVYLPTAMTAPEEPFAEIGVGEGGIPAEALWLEVIKPSIEGEIGPL